MSGKVFQLIPAGLTGIILELTEDNHSQFFIPKGFPMALQSYQKQKKVMVHENSDRQKEYHQLNINDDSIICSPYYLQQNDVIHAEPRKAEAHNAFFSSNTSILFCVTSALMSIATFIIVQSK